MKNLKATLLPCMLVFAVVSLAADPAIDESSKATDTLLLASKDELHGIFLGGDKAAVNWKLAGSGETQVFKTSQIVHVNLGSARLPPGAARPTVLVRLANGDELPGVLRSLDDKTLALDTWFAGLLAIPRDAVRSITMFDNRILYMGPSGLDGWTDFPVSGGNTKCWDYSGGEFLPTGAADGSLFRDVGLPPVATVEFDAVAGEGSLIGAYLYVGKKADGYCVQFAFVPNGRCQVRVLRYDAGGITKMRFLRDVAATDAWKPDEKAHISLRTNEGAKTISLYVNGKLVKQFTDPDAFADHGREVGFYARANAHVRFSNLVVTAGDGATGETHDASRPPATDTVEVTNGDRLSGKLKSIADGKVTLLSPISEMTVPLDRVALILLAPAQGAVPENPGAVRASLTGGGALTLQIESWDEKQITATSPDFGKAVFLPDAFQRLQFNPGQQASPPGENAPTADDEPSVPVPVILH